MRLGILGTGMIVKDMLTGIHDLKFEYVAILGTEATRDETEQLKEKYNLDKTYYDYDELLSSDIDTVYVALPNHLHYSFGKKALLAGKHVILEKPCTANLYELMELKDIASEKHLIMLEASTVNYFPVVRQLKKELSNVGNVHIVTLNFSQYSSRYDKFMNGEVLPVFDPNKAGGALMDLNVYNINFMLGVFGKPDKIHYFPNIDRGIDTSGILVMDYGHFKASCIAAKDCKAPATVMIQGDKGYIYSTETMNKATKFSIVKNDGDVKEMEFADDHHRLFYEFEAFIHMIDDKDYEEAERMLSISVAISELMEECRWKEGIVFSNDKKITEEK
ncbi:MAG: Gfo/Idh/MocA family oxidoreductase [Lachnospiraceae bacterium]|nr:Gfo/Idh/MocA family oxidoreductase [Lachnospiraceae bacterium]